MELWYPAAKRPLYDPSLQLTTHGKFPKGYPEGAVVHYTAGVPDSNGAELIQAKKDGYTFMLIGADGTVFQAHPLDEWGYHAGGSTWPAFPHEVSVHTVGIEVACPGLLKGKKGRYETEWGKAVSDEDARVCEARDNIHAGTYFAYTKEQEAALIRLLVWLETNGAGIFSYDLVLGHDEVAPGRKEDPGGSLSQSMPEFRSFLKSQGIS